MSRLVVLVFVVFCLCYVSRSSAANYNVGKCPTIAANPHLDMSKVTLRPQKVTGTFFSANEIQLSGEWILAANYGLRCDPVVSQCRKIVVEEGNQENEITMIRKIIVNKKEESTETKLQPSTTLDGVFNVISVGDTSKKTSADEGQRTTDWRFTVLDTDYNCYAVTYECKQAKKGYSVKGVGGLNIIYSEISAMFLLKNTEECLKSSYTEIFDYVLILKGVSNFPTTTWYYAAGCQ